MKLLLDQNLAPRLARDLFDIFPDSAHVRDLRMAEASDREIWEHATERTRGIRDGGREPHVASQTG